MTDTYREHLVGYRGTITGLNARGNALIFSTEHPEGQPTGVYEINVDDGRMSAFELEVGGTAQLITDDWAWLAGTDQRLWAASSGEVVTAVSDPFGGRIVGLAEVDGGVAAIEREALHIVDRTGEIRATFDVGEPVRSVASDPSGKFVATGTSRGHIAVFQLEDGEWIEGTRERLHDGEVTAMMFSPDELRLYTTGLDCRLLISYVRGSVDTEDRGGNNMHDRAVEAMVLGPTFSTEKGAKQRFYTGGLDSSIKAWPRGRGGTQRPATQSNAVVQTTALAVVEHEGDPMLAAAGRDGSIRVFELGEEGRVGGLAVMIRDAYALAEDMLNSSKPTTRSKALEDLASYNDERALDMLSRQVYADPDHKLQVQATELLARTGNDRSVEHLEELLGHGAEDVRRAAFHGLRDLCGHDDTRPLLLATTSGFEDLGLLGVKGLSELGTDAAIELLRSTLDQDPSIVRLAALGALEKQYGDAPEGTLTGLRSTREDVRRTALVRLYRRGFLDRPQVEARLRRLWDDDDARVRQWAFYVSLFRRPNLARALRAADDQVHRHLFEIEEFDRPEEKRREELPAAKPFSPGKLKDADLRPLLEAMASRKLDVCLRGARGLAALGDERAFGTLLQLSRESEAAARVSAAKALQALGDPRSIKRLRMMLHDGDPQVRDAAFSALAALESSQPLRTARAALAANAVDVRQRALQLLVTTVRESGASEEAQELLLTALNDGDHGVRQEAFKSTLNLEIEGGGPKTLRFLLQSIHADVRWEVLQEAMAYPGDETYRAVVLDMFADEGSRNREAAFRHALDRWPSDQHRTAFERALTVRHTDLRLEAVMELARLDGAAVTDLLVQSLDDEDSVVRLAVVEALVDDENRSLLAAALDSNYEDVRVEAAAALAALGDSRALDRLLHLLAQWRKLVAEATAGHELQARMKNVLRALDGIASLGNPAAIDEVVALLDSGHPEIRRAAASALVWVAHEENLERVRNALRHEDQTVRQQAALALAFNGDATGVSEIFGQVSHDDQLIAAYALREQSQDRFLAFVDGGASTRNWALALVLLLELSEHEGVPERCVSLLSAQQPRVRLTAAQAIEAYAEQPEFYAWVYRTVNGLGNERAEWDIEPRILLALSRAVTFGEPAVAIRAARLLSHLREPSTEAFERQWGIFEDRFGDRLEALENEANTDKSQPLSERLARAWRRLKETARSLVVEPRTFEEALASLAFGAYVGLSRQYAGGDSHIVRAAAVSGLTRLAAESERFRADAISSLLPSLGDNNQTVRERAFEALRKLGASVDLLSTEALSTGFSDMGFRGLELLASSDADGDPTTLLRHTLLDSTNGLENEAAKLLAEEVGWVETRRIGLSAASQSMRGECVRGLAREYEASDEAADALRSALDSAHEDVRFTAAFQLAAKKDGAAYDTLIEMLGADDYSRQSQAIRGLASLGDERAPAALLDRVEDDPDTANVAELVQAAANYRDPSIADRLMEWVDADTNRGAAFNAALQLSGFPQYEWMEDEDVTEEWEASINETHPGLFTDLLDLAYRIGESALLSDLVPLAKWPPESGELDRLLGALLTYSDDNLRHRAVEMAGWRLRHRNGPFEGLVGVLSTGDPLDQFFAAESLALAGRSEGLPVLRTSVDVMDDFSLRERAVLAVGHLADPSTVDMLLTIAEDDEHILQRAAAEAIGHMSNSERADEIFAILARLAQSHDYQTKNSALKGLRWFDTRSAWELVRRAARDNSWLVRSTAAELLRHDQDSREFVAERLREESDWDVCQTLADSLRHLWGPDALEPDYVLVQAHVSGLAEQNEALRRLRERGDASRILEVLPKIPDHNEDQFVQPLVGALLSREPLPVEEAAAMLGSNEARTASVAARIVGRAGSRVAADHGSALTTAIRRAREDWGIAWSDFQSNRQGAGERLNAVSSRYRWLLWAAGQLHVADDEIVAAARLPAHQRSQPIREEALATLGDEWFADSAEEVLRELAVGGDARIRAMAAAELSRLAPEAGRELLADSMKDDVSVGRLAATTSPDDARAVFLEAVTDPDVAGVALPRLAAVRDVSGLAQAMRNQALADRVRVGAIDALGTIAQPEVAELLAEFGSDEEEDETLRKAAWRARRRVTRSLR